MDDLGVSPEAAADLPQTSELFDRGPDVMHSRLKRRKDKVKEKLVDRALKFRTRTFASVEEPRSVQKGPWSPRIQELLGAIPQSQIRLAAGCNWPPVLRGCLDLYSGKAGFAKEMLGCPWVVTFDIAHSPAEDLGDPRVRELIEELVRGKVFEIVSAAPVCSSFSRAITPAVRTREYPRGAPGLRHTMAQKVEMGNDHSAWLAGLVEIVLTRCVLG